VPEFLLDDAGETYSVVLGRSIVEVDALAQGVLCDEQAESGYPMGAQLDAY
jgi:hypothetical protein